MSYELIESRRLSLEDLHRVLTPDSAKWKIGSEANIYGVDGAPLRGSRKREEILRKIESGELVLLGVRGDLYGASGQLKNHLPYAITARISSLQPTAGTTRYVKAHYAPFDPETNMYETVAEVATRALGAGKQFVNDFVLNQAAQIGEHLSKKGVIVATETETGKVLTPEEVSQAYLDSGHEMFAIEGGLEQQGADTLKQYESYQAIVPIISAAAGGYKGIFKLAQDPKLLSDLLEAALRDARSIPEALGQLGMEHAKHRLEISTHPDYVNRFHGPDCIGLDNNCTLVEIESKGTTGASRAVSTNSRGMKQGSSDKNMLRGQQMRKKRKKVGQNSNRQGGPYREDEIELWNDIYAMNGEKRHILVNTDISSGEVRVYEQDANGNIIKTLDEFVIEGFDEAKSVISKRF
ncbi:hypothetical protein L4174_023940 (plasmid) [Photobacterium sp. CCB-ST2H9]|uniref:hypothetical protein n=1 Tax=Photobacterium sp. CCB-ST2H9 TaxID=2912855 RepID=UPI00200554DF|nr:hypothetical protein [Photobacterium sp. CCB-ST2H9]UTM60439.1 hypothetical protein L4174_023940 [Photobacterium sp. CCB-ST2H9]